MFHGGLRRARQRPSLPFRQMIEPPSSSSALPPPSEPGEERVFVFRENDRGGEGPERMVAFKNVEVRALGYDVLVSARLHEPLTIPLGWDGASVTHTNIPDLDLARFYSANSTLESPFTSNAIGLVKGGWLPSILAATRDNAVVLLDRNIVPQLLARFGDGKAAKPDFLDLFADRPVRLHPLLCVMEGNQREIPGPDQVQAELVVVAGKLAAAMPQAQVLADPLMLRGALGLIEDARASFGCKQAFLMQVAPLLSTPVGKGRLPEVWRAILAAADEAGVRRDALVVLAALSVAAIPNGRSPATGLLKCRAQYAPADAYNALADLRALELLMGLFAMYPHEQIQLCTSDRALALFWSSLRASNFRRLGDGFGYDLTPVDALLPKPALDRWLESLPKSEADARQAVVT